MRSVAPLCSLAGFFWFLIFSPWTYGRLNFWGAISAATFTLAGIALSIQRERTSTIYSFKPSHLMIGIASAAVLYLAFFLGDMVATSFFSFAKTQVSAIYRVRDQASPVLIGLILLLVTGPGEEVFWRGFVQHQLAAQSSDVKGYLSAALIYAGVHVFSLNFMLFMAALLCGLF